MLMQKAFKIYVKMHNYRVYIVCKYLNTQTDTHTNVQDSHNNNTNNTNNNNNNNNSTTPADICGSETHHTDFRAVTPTNGSC